MGSSDRDGAQFGWPMEAGVAPARMGQPTKDLWDRLESSIREAAGRLRRDVKAVHGNVTALLNAGLLQRAPGGGVVFPCDAVKVEFLLRAA